MSSRWTLAGIAGEAGGGVFAGGEVEGHADAGRRGLGGVEEAESGAAGAAVNGVGACSVVGGDGEGLAVELEAGAAAFDAVDLEGAPRDAARVASHGRRRHDSRS